MTSNMRFGLRTVAALAALAFGACGGGEDKGGGDENKDAGAPGGSRDSSTASPGTGAEAGALPVAQLDDNVAGKPCTGDGDCKGTGGSCAFNTCTGTCETDEHCGAGGTCLKVATGALGQYGGCVKRCDAKTDCSDGQDCRENIDLGDLIGEAASAARDAGLSLDDAGIDVEVSNVPKTCGPELKVVQLADGVVGKPCTMAAQCAPGTCADEVNFLETFPNGYCSGSCTSDSHCGAKGICYKNPIAGAFKSEGVCLLGCSGASDCPSGLACRASQVLLESRTYCLTPIPDAGAPAADSGAGGADAGAQDAAAGGG